MNVREKNVQSYFFKYSVPVLLGTVANIISTYVTLPLQYIFTQRQLYPSKSYANLSRFTFSSDGMKEVYRESKIALRMAPKQSFAYLGVSSFALEYYKNNSSLMRGMKAGLWSGVAESIATANDLQKMIAGWNGTQLNQPNKWVIFHRSLQGTMIKNAVANPLTLAIYCYSEEVMQRSIQSKSPICSMLAGMISAFLAAPFVAPFSTLQTRLQNNPSLSIFKHMKELAIQPPSIIFSGMIGRGTYKMVDSVIKFGIRASGLTMIERYGQQKEMRLG